MTENDYTIFWWLVMGIAFPPLGVALLLMLWWSVRKQKKRTRSLGQ